MACVAVNSLIRTLELEFLPPEPRPILQEMELIPFNKELIQSLHSKLGFLIQLFDERRMDGVEAIKDLEIKLRDVAFRVEDEIELHVVHLYKEADEEMGQGDTEAMKTQHCHRLSHVLQQAIEDIYAIKEELEKVMMEYKHVIAVQGRETKLVDELDDELVKTDGSGSSNCASHTEDIMVGKNNEFDIIMKTLIQHSSKQREVVSIQGMGGIGKTTLARRVYENPSTVSHFDRRLWVVVSQHHNKKQMLLGLLGSKDNVNNSTDGDLALQLYQSLKGQRYLVVIDDVWSRESWDDVNSCFPDDINGSRVLLTTRIAVVATCIGSNNYFSHQLQFLDQSESWELFHKKACKSHGVEFETIGRPIVEKCKGLALAILVIAGLFSKLDTLDEWKKTANALISSTSTSTLDDDECWKILSFSYSHLPHNLKACFLYLGVFPEDDEINANNLARLWAAEGRVKAFKNESFEAVAKSLQACQCDQESLTKVTYLKKVSIIIRKPNDRIIIRKPNIDEPNDCIKNLVSLQQLESLSLCVVTDGIPDLMPQIINNILLLKSIRKLTFRKMKSEWKAINVLSKLPRLEVLKLRNSELGKKWEVPENVKFCHLICLKISHGNLKHWEAGVDNFPKLERLFFNDCSELREIPNSYAEIPTLNLIQLKRCLPSAVMSAKQIEAEQHDYGNENMVVIEKYRIKPRSPKDNSDEDEE
ncbi:PREDICTED: putative late blight resistance protein homolog R1B-12 isoform X2 [Ipomoea nil]|uniref:putative late blight resistance protein homolog R1B-12 isoform X2 n=1 Tax=Ipomoea nil TaxID=35883 RepID=UPI000900E743|nr:PREDICTED: putative late blight resistance protein homolog R1B-12 isoform X2 [Ipomoea nil]